MVVAEEGRTAGQPYSCKWFHVGERVSCQPASVASMTNSQVAVRIDTCRSNLSVADTSLDDFVSQGNRL